MRVKGEGKHRSISGLQGPGHGADMLGALMHPPGGVRDLRGLDSASLDCHSDVCAV